MPLSFINDLKTVLGACGLTRISHLTASETGNIVNGPCEVYTLAFYVSGAGGDARWNLIDATATSVGGTAVFTFRPVAVGQVPNVLARPLYFSKGLSINYTATAGNFSTFMQYSPLSTTRQV